MRTHKNAWTFLAALARLLETVATGGLNLIVRYVRKKLGPPATPDDKQSTGRKEKER